MIIHTYIRTHTPVEKFSSISLAHSLTHAHAHAHTHSNTLTHARTHAQTHTHARTHAHTRTRSQNLHANTQYTHIIPHTHTIHTHTIHAHTQYTNSSSLVCAFSFTFCTHVHAHKNAHIHSSSILLPISALTYFPIRFSLVYVLSFSLARWMNRTFPAVNYLHT